MAWKVEYSSDGGTSWTQAGSDFTATADVQTFSETLNISGNIRIKISLVTDTGTSNKRMNIDDILLTDYSGSVQPLITVSPGSLSGFTYEEGFGPSAVQSFDVQGSNLLANIQIQASQNYELSLNEGSGFSGSLSLSPQSGTLDITTVYVRMVSGLDGDSYVGSIELSSTNAISRMISLSGEVSEAPVAGNYLVNFEGDGEIKMGYASGTVNLSGIDWNMTEALIGEMSTDLINGLRAARMRGYGTSAMSMLEDKSGGLGSLSFQYKQYGTDTRVSWRAEYSTNGGTTWMQAGADFTPSEFGDAQSFSALINVPGNVRVRIRTVEDTGTTDARLNIDDILLTEYDDTAQPMIAINPSSLSGFSYEEGFGPSTVQSFQVQGANLLGNIQISAPLHFELSQSAEGTFGNSLSLVHQDGSVSATTIYVRLISGLATGNYNGSIELTSPDASLQEISLSGSVSPVIIIDGYVVDFEGEGEVKAAYESGTVTLSGIDWNMTEALIGNTTADQINGSKSARLRGYGTSAMTMLGDKSDGLGSLSFFYRRYGSDSQVAWKAEYSIDGGITWIQAGEDFVAANNDETQSFSATINISSPGRIRIRTAESSGSSNARLNLDDISVTDYSGTTDPQIAVNPTNLSGFGYNEGFGPSASQSFALTAVFLSANLLLSASTDYEISLDNSFYQQQIDLTPQDGTVAQPIYVRLKDNLLSGTYNGSVQISSVGAEQKTVILTGNVSTLLLPDAPIALDATEVTSSSFKANWQAVNGASSYKLDVYTVSSEGGFDDLIISEYIEGSGTNKALEIYNGTGSTVSLTDYKVQILSNGNPTPSFSIDLGGNLANGDVYVLAHASAHADILAEADYLNAYAVSFNGNDAVAIYNTITEQYVDIFGVIGDDPGTAWTASGGYSTLDRTLVRKPEVRSGITQNPVGTGGDAFTTLSTEWNMYPTDTFSYIGTHSLSRRSISYVAGYQNLDVGNVSSYVVNGLAPDTDYYYVVRAANANGSSENSNTIEAFTQVISTPTVQARQIEAAITSNTITLEWTPGNGAKRIVVMNTQNFFNTPADGTDPVANPIYGGSGQQVVYNDATQIIEDAPFNGVLVEGLEASTTYHFRVFEYNGFGSNTMYLSSTATGNPSQFTTLSGGFTGYYEDIDGYGTALKAELHDLLRTTHATQYSYDALWTQLRYTDEDPNNSNNIIQIYTGWSIPKSNYGGGITQWNREHTWSKSHGDFGESRPAGTDLHHMRPCDATVNSAKGNKDFDEGGSLYVDASPYQGYSGNTGNYTTTYSWEPRDEEKGDVARMIMYMAVRYEGTDTSYDLEIVDYSNTAPNNEPYYGELSTLLTWHEQDPPDEWELQRNERIAERQGNRNPFVDHPEFAYMLWTPYPLGATTVTTSSFTANWNQPIIGSAYYLQVATDPEFTSFVSGYNNFNAGTSTSKVISGLSSGSTYYYRLRTAFQNGYSMYSPAQMVTTISPEPQATTASININNGNVILTITSVPGATAYLVFASDEPYGEFGDVSAQGSFDGNVWTSPVGEITQRFFKVYGVWE
ncbi:MAG: endonuclease [Candidatus Cloacimonetes bacterium]|nr:endonuclease [Candidatus Cloacimonadota bacterium]